ncbi:hypothetical protein LJC60_01955 [Ruminococcaceae bacterium OttesenSCG-928-D13]|nr:hypothetical protein [Ruminococcaceae bacterium OttesenSCG-928-D13]
MAEYQLKTGKVGKKVVDTYKKIENGTVACYEAIEKGVVSGYKKAEKRFVDAFLNETPAEDAPKSDEGEKI